MTPGSANSSRQLDVYLGSTLQDDLAPPPLPHDVNFEIRPSGYEIWFPDRIANDHPDLVDQCADRPEDEFGVVNLGQIDHKCPLTDGVLGDELKRDIVPWWPAKVPDLDQGRPVQQK